PDQPPAADVAAVWPGGGAAPRRAGWRLPHPVGRLARRRSSNPDRAEDGSRPAGPSRRAPHARGDRRGGRARLITAARAAPRVAPALPATPGTPPRRSTRTPSPRARRTRRRAADRTRPSAPARTPRVRAARTPDGPAAAPWGRSTPQRGPGGAHASTPPTLPTGGGPGVPAAPTCVACPSASRRHRSGGSAAGARGYR